MYLISVYFDDQTNRVLGRYIDKISEMTGNHFMTDNHVPPHMTISSIEARSGDILLPHMEKLMPRLSCGEVSFVSIGALLPYVLYVTPVLNQYLQELSDRIYDAVKNVPETTVSRFYQPMQWLPHVTLGKKLDRDQMQTAFALMQERFAPFDGKVVSVGLAKTNPHEDIFRVELKGAGRGRNGYT